MEIKIDLNMLRSRHFMQVAVWFLKESLKMRRYDLSVWDASMRSDFFRHVDMWLNRHFDDRNGYEWQMFFNESVWPPKDDELYGKLMVFKVRSTPYPVYHIFRVDLRKNMGECCFDGDGTPIRLFMEYGL